MRRCTIAAISTEPKALNRKSVNRFLVVWLLVVWSGFVFRVDRFPLTWVPMYSHYEPEGSESRHRIVDQEAMQRGLEVTRRDGSTGFVGNAELNIPKWNMYRLYYQRAHGQQAVKHRHGNTPLAAYNRWLRGLEEGEPNYVNDGEFLLFQSLNKTLGLEPDDAGFIVRIQASADYVVYRRNDFHYSKTETRLADLRWNEDWRRRW
jgi:hypothetical protein